MSRPRLLLLAPAEHSWRLDEQTRLRGKAGVAKARDALAKALAVALTEDHLTAASRRDAA